jgi:predicted esterase
MVTRSLTLLCALLLTSACADPPVDDEGAASFEDEASSDASSSDESTTSDEGTSESGMTLGTGEADTSSSSSTTSDATTNDATTDDATTDTSDTSSTTGGAEACPSGGGGGSVGQAPISSPEYPNTPGVVYVPQSYDGQPIPVMLALHGSGDTAGNFVGLWSGIAEREGFIVLVPESLSGGASWNPGNDTQVIAALLDVVAAQWNVDECRIYLTGYSAGAHYGYMLGLANADYFAALGIQAGTLAYAEQAGVWPNMVPRPIAVDIHHGQGDPYVPLSEATHARDELEAAGHVVYFATHGGGHEIGPGDPEAMWANLAQHSVNE